MKIKKEKSFIIPLHKEKLQHFLEAQEKYQTHVNSQGRKVYNPDLSDVNTNIKNNFISQLYCLKFFPVAFVHNSRNIAPFDP